MRRRTAILPGTAHSRPSVCHSRSPTRLGEGYHDPGKFALIISLMLKAKPSLVNLAIDWSAILPPHRQLCIYF
jgi:hypothetical protein